MRCIVIEASKRPVGLLSNAVLTPEYSCTDKPLIEYSEPLIYDWEHCRSLCMSVSVHVCWRAMRERELESLYEHKEEEEYF